MSNKQDLSLDSKDVRAEMLSQATNWLLERELLDNPAVKNALVLNLYKVSAQIREVELLIDQPGRKMLVLLILSPFGRMFKKQAIAKDVLDMLSGVLPAFQFRVIWDQALFQKALDGFQRHLERKAQVPPIEPQSESPKDAPTVAPEPQGTGEA